MDPVVKDGLLPARQKLATASRRVGCERFAKLLLMTEDIGSDVARIVDDGRPQPGAVVDIAQSRPTEPPPEPSSPFEGFQANGAGHTDRIVIEDVRGLMVLQRPVGHVKPKRDARDMAGRLLGLDVRFVSYGTPSREIVQIAKDFAQGC